jgi:hypothetical protein
MWLALYGDNARPWSEAFQGGAPTAESHQNEKHSILLVLDRVYFLLFRRACPRFTVEGKGRSRGKATWYASLSATDARRIIDRFKELYPKIDVLPDPPKLAQGFSAVFTADEVYANFDRYVSCFRILSARKSCLDTAEPECLGVTNEPIRRAPEAIQPH